MAGETNSGIYKIDGYRIIAASAQRAAMDSEGDTISSTYLKKADFTTASGIWEDAASAVSANSSTWNNVTAKVDTATYNAYTATADVTEYSAGANIDITDHVISGKNWTTDIQDASANAVTTVEGKFTYDTDNFITAYNGSSFAGKQYTGADGIEITNANVIRVSADFVTSATAASATDKLLVLHNNAWVELPDTEGGYLTADSAAGGVPDVATGASALKYIYLVKDGTAPGADKYNEWIFTSADASTTAWEKIGDTSIDLNDYATTSFVDNDYVSKASTANWDVTPYSAGANIALSPDHTISGKDWTNDITATASNASANAVTTVEGKFGVNGDGKITAFNTSAIAQPDVSEFVTNTSLETTLEDYQPTSAMTAYLPSATYAAASGKWEDVSDVVQANSGLGKWTHNFTVVEVPNLANIPDITNP